MSHMYHHWDVRLHSLLRANVCLGSSTWYTVILDEVAWLTKKITKIVPGGILSFFVMLCYVMLWLFRGKKSLNIESGAKSDSSELPTCAESDVGVCTYQYHVVSPFPSLKNTIAKLVRGDTTWGLLLVFANTNV